MHCCFVIWCCWRCFFEKNVHVAVASSIFFACLFKDERKGCEMRWIKSWCGFCFLCRALPFVSGISTVCTKIRKRIIHGEAIFYETIAFAQVCFSWKMKCYLLLPRKTCTTTTTKERAKKEILSRVCAVLPDDQRRKKQKAFYPDDVDDWKSVEIAECIAFAHLFFCLPKNFYYFSFNVLLPAFLSAAVFCLHACPTQSCHCTMNPIIHT